MIKILFVTKIMCNDTGFTIEEDDLLNRLAAWEFDGLVGKEQPSIGCLTEWIAIIHGIPVKYREAPAEKQYQSGKIICQPGKLVKEKEWITEEEKLDFLGECGHMINDSAVRKYALRMQNNSTRQIYCYWPSTLS